MENPLKVFKPKLYKTKLHGHWDAIVSLYSPSGTTGFILHSMSKDGGLRSWDIARKQMPHKETLKGWDKYPRLTCSVLSGNIVYTGFEGGQLTSWSFLTGELLNDYKGHSAYITSITKANVRVLVSGSLDRTIIVWDTVSGQSQVVFRLEQEIDLVQTINEEEIAFLEGKRAIGLISLRTRQLVFKFKFNDFITGFCLKDNQLIIGTVDQALITYSIKSLNQKKYQPISVLKGNVSGWPIYLRIHQEWLFLLTDSKYIYVFRYPQRSLLTSFFF